MAKTWKDLSPEEKVLRILGSHQANVSLAKEAVLKLLRTRPIEGMPVCTGNSDGAMR